MKKGSLCLRRVLYSRSFNPVRAALTIFQTGPNPSRVWMWPSRGLVLVLWLLIPPGWTLQLVMRQKTAAVVPLITDKRAHIMRRVCALERRGDFAPRLCFFLISLLRARRHLSAPLVDEDEKPPVLFVAGSCQRGLWLHMTSGRLKSGPWFLRSPPLSSRS